MSRKTYYDFAKEALATQAVAATGDMTRTEIEAAIASISTKLLGTTSNVERLWLLEERTMLRNKLASAA